MNEVLLFFTLRLGSNDMKICGFQKLDCITKAENDLLIAGAADICDCLPHCNMLIYDISLQQTQHYLPKNFIEYGLNTSMGKK